MISRANTLFKLCWKTAEGTKIFFEDLSRNASGFEKKTGQQCSGKIKKLGLIIGRLNTVEEKLVEVGRNGLFFKAMDVVLGHKPTTCPQL